MFKPTLPLKKRVAQRLRGFRGPAIRILRKAIANIHPRARVKPFAVPHVEPSRNLTFSEAWPLPGCPHPLGFLHPWEEHRVLRTKDDFIGARLREALYRVPIHPTAVHQSSGDATAMVGSRGVKPSRYKPSATVYWSHSIYRYNKAAISSLPPLTRAVSKLLRVYLNMSSRIPEPSNPFSFAEHAHGRNILRAYLSDQKADNSYIRPDILGKISFRKKGFWVPFRQLLECQPRITFKHRQSGVGIMLFVYDRRLEVLRQRLARLRSALVRVSQASP